MIRVSELKMPIEGNQKTLEKKLAKALRVPVEEIKAYRIFKRSLDARKKDNIHYAYVVDAEVENEKKILEKNKDKNISETPFIILKRLPTAILMPCVFPKPRKTPSWQWSISTLCARRRSAWQMRCIPTTRPR